MGELFAKKRLGFAKMYRNDSLNFCGKSRPTDKNKFNILKSSDKIIIWRKQKFKMDEKNLILTVRHGGGSLLAWGRMSANEVGDLHIFNEHMDHKAYINIMKCHLHRSVESMELSADYILSEYNDPKHTARNTKMWRVCITKPSQ